MRADEKAVAEYFPFSFFLRMKHSGIQGKRNILRCGKCVNSRSTVDAVIYNNAVNYNKYKIANCEISRMTFVTRGSLNRYKPRGKCPYFLNSFIYDRMQPLRYCNCADANSTRYNLCSIVSRNSCSARNSTWTWYAFRFAKYFKRLSILDKSSHFSSG